MEPRALPRIGGLKKCMGWPLGAHVISTYTSVPPSPSGAVFAKDALPPNYLLQLASSNPHNVSAPSNLLRETIVRPILEDTTLMTGILLALFLVFVVSYVRSPWRKLPSGPRRLPVIGNALQLSDINWLLSKDCKDSFGELPQMYQRCVTPKSRGCRRGYVP
jgi:hypothetical protein